MDRKARSGRRWTEGVEPEPWSTYVDRVADARRLAADAAAPDPAVGLAAVAALRRLLEQLEALQVDNARAQGWLWSDIACRLGVSKQAVHRKHASRLRLLGKAAR
jgi:hypothetical protein